jgi:hypothetical protein
MPKLSTLFCLIVVGLVLVAGQAAHAQPDGLESDLAAPGGVSLTHDLGRPLMLSIVFTVIGVALFAVSIWVMVKFAPFPVIKEIEEDQNIALAIIMAAVILGLSIILAAAMIG